LRSADACANIDGSTVIVRQKSYVITSPVPPMTTKNNYSKLSNRMLKENIKIRSVDGPDFDCYVASPESSQKTPAIVLASSINGVDMDLRRIADEFASCGYIAAAPDLFWRTEPGPLPRGDQRSTLRGQPRLERLEAGERDLADVLRMLHMRPLFSGRAAVMGFCYSGPYAILGPKCLGYAAGISCHGSNMLDFVGELEGMQESVCIIWGDQDHLAPANVLNAYRGLSERVKNVEVHVFPNVQHGFMMKSNKNRFDRNVYKFSMDRALAILQCL
jgi:carboxymethylenebutenolidase